MSTTQYLKWTAKGRVPSYQGGTPIPYRKWTQQVPDLKLCAQGWHACRWEDAVHHIDAELWVVELDGQIIEGDTKVVAERLRIVRRVRLDDRALRLFAADCAKTVLPLFEARCPNDDRPRRAIQAARDYANGLIDSAASAAAEAAADSAANCAARSADSAAYWAADSAADSATDLAAHWTAFSAAHSAAHSAADSAANCAADWAADCAADSAARSAARSAQTTNLLVNYGGLNPADFAHKGTP